MALYCFRVTNGAAEPQEGVTLVFGSNPMLDLVQTSCLPFPLKDNTTPTVLKFRSTGNAIHVPTGGVSTGGASADVTLVCAGTIPPFNTYWWNAPAGPDTGTRRTSITCSTMSAAPAGSVGVLWNFSTCEAADPGTRSEISELRLLFYESRSPHPDPKVVGGLLNRDSPVSGPLREANPTAVAQIGGAGWRPASRTVELPPGGGVVLRAQCDRHGPGKYIIAVAAGVESRVDPDPDPVRFVIADLAPGQYVEARRALKDQDE